MNKYEKQVAEIARRGSQMRDLCINSQFDPVTGEYLADVGARMAAIDNAAKEVPMFESMAEEHVREVISGMQSSVREYEATYNELPTDEMLASAHRSMEGLLMLESVNDESGEAKMMLESIGTSLQTSQGVEIRAKMVGLVLPVVLASATSHAVTMIPAAHDEVEIFKVRRKTGSAFGDFAKGTELDATAAGQYSSMRQRYDFATQPDGTTTEFTFDTSTDLENTSEAIPFKPQSTSLWIDRKKAIRGTDSSSTTVSGTYTNSEDTAIVVSMVLDNDNGTATVTFATAPDAGAELALEFEVDIETNPDLIPLIDHDMYSATLRPYQRAIAADATIQAMFTFQREFGQDYKSMQLSHLRNYLANEKALGVLRDMDYACTNSTTFNIYVPTGEDWKLHREQLNEKFQEISQAILSATKVTGMTGMFAGTNACRILKSLGSDHFTPAANYRQTNHVHYAGKLFGMWRVYEDPIILDEDDILCYGRGVNHSEAGYVAGDAIPATMYNHTIGSSLRARNTLYELTYGEIHPFDGEDYFYRLTITDVEE